MTPFSQGVPPTGALLDAPAASPVHGTPLDAALWWLRQGYTPLPIACGTKKPPPRFRIKPLLEGSRPSEGEVQSWFQRWTDAQVGVVLGKSLVVVDSDNTEAETMIVGMNLPVTPTARTSRGSHRYFRVDRPIQTRVLKAGNGASLELRGTGSYVVSPPSVHPTGVAYEWEVSPRDVPFAPLPAEIGRLLEVGVDEGGEGKDPPGPLPAHLAEVLHRHPRLRDVFEGRVAPSDTSGSGRDFLLLHVAYKAGLTASDATELIHHALYEKRNPRTKAYIAHTLPKVYRSGTGGNTGPKPGAYGRVPADVVNSGLLRSVGANAALLYTVLRVRMMRSKDVDVTGVAGVVRDGRATLEALTGLSRDQMKRAVSRLRKAGLIRLQRWLMGTMIWVLDPAHLGSTSAPQVKGEERREVPGVPGRPDIPNLGSTSAPQVTTSPDAPGEDPSGSQEQEPKNTSPPTIHDHEAPREHQCALAQFHLGSTSAPKGGGDSDEEVEISEASPTGEEVDPWD